MKTKKNKLEWAVFAASLALIGAVAAILVHQYVTGSHSPPSITITSGDAIETNGRFALPLEVRNGGDTTAEDVILEVTLSWAGGQERGEATLPYVPYRSHRRVWVTFSRDPRNGQLSSRIVGYREP